MDYQNNLGCGEGERYFNRSMRAAGGGFCLMCVSILYRF